MGKSKLLWVGIFVLGMTTTMIMKPLLDVIFFNTQLIRKDCDADKAYCFYAVRYNTFLSSRISFNVSRYVEEGYPDYGHFIDYPFPYAPSRKDEDNQIRKATVQFTNDGITYTHPTNHVVFIPRTEYIGGR